MQKAQLPAYNTLSWGKIEQKMKAFRYRLCLLLGFKLLWSTCVLAEPAPLTEELKNLVSSLEEEKDRLVSEKIGLLREVKIKNVEFNATPLGDALGNIEERIREQSKIEVNFHIADSVALSNNVNISLRDLSTDRVLHFVSGSAGATCSIHGNDVYIYDPSETLGLPPAVQHLDSKLWQITYTLESLQRRLDAIQNEIEVGRTIEHIEKLIFDEVSFESQGLQEVCNLLNQRIEDKRDGEEPSVWLIFNAPSKIDPEVTYHAKEVSLQQVVREIAKEIGWHVEYRQSAILMHAERRDEGDIQRIRRLRSEPLAPYLPLSKPYDGENGVVLRMQESVDDNERKTQWCELINNTKYPIYFVSGSMLSPEYEIASVDQDGERLEETILDCGTGLQAAYTPELPPNSKTRFEVTIPSDMDSFQIGVEIGRKHYSPAYAAATKKSILQCSSLGKVWTNTIYKMKVDREKPQQNAGINSVTSLRDSTP